MASLDWTDSVGSASLDNGESGPMARFSTWTVLPDSMKDAAEGLGDGVVHVFTFGPRYDVSFILPNIPHDQQALLARFERHARDGGVFQITTGDASSHVYPTCQCPKDAPPTKAFNTQTRRWDLTVTARNVAGSPVELICVYS